MHSTLIGVLLYAVLISLVICSDQSVRYIMYRCLYHLFDTYAVVAHTTLTD
jgi:hypothetical protein